MASPFKSTTYLRALDVSDLERVFAWHNDPALYEYLGGNFRWVSHATEEEWLRKRCAYSANETSLAICISETREHIGNIYLRDIDWVSRHAELHIFIGTQEHRGQGYGESALRQALAHGFEDIGLQRIFLYVLASNQPAIRLYMKCGFQEEGRLRRHVFKKGQHQDLLVMGVLLSEWESQHNP